MTRLPEKAAKVLLVDDNAIVREVVREALGAAGFEVVTVSSPFAFSAALLREQPDVALIDVSMPALSGPELVDFFRRHSAQRLSEARNDAGERCALVLFSDSEEEELARWASECGADAFVSKRRGYPFLASRLSEIVDQIR